jgi:hypothetical protein
VQQSESPETVDLSRRERLALVGPASKRYQDFHSVPLAPDRPGIGRSPGENQDDSNEAAAFAWAISLA